MLDVLLPNHHGHVKKRIPHLDDGIVNMNLDQQPTPLDSCFILISFNNVIPCIIDVGIVIKDYYAPFMRELDNSYV